MTTSENDRSAAVKAVDDDSASKDNMPPVPRKDNLHVAQNAKAPENDLSDKRPAEHGGQAGLEPTRYGDWEKKGRCTDF